MGIEGEGTGGKCGQGVYVDMEADALVAGGAEAQYQLSGVIGNLYAHCHNRRVSQCHVALHLITDIGKYIYTLYIKNKND